MPDSGLSYEIISLSQLLQTSNKENIQKMLATFRPYKDSSAGIFLQERAIMMEQRDLARTYLAIDSSNKSIKGFITIGIKCLTIGENCKLSNNMIKNMFIDPKTKVVQAYLLAQLVRSEDSPKGFGSVLIDEAMYILNDAKGLVGGRLVRIDCEDELIPYYESKGFRYVNTNSEGTLNQMLTFITPLPDESS